MAIMIDSMAFAFCPSPSGQRLPITTTPRLLFTNPFAPSHYQQACEARVHVHLLSPSSLSPFSSPSSSTSNCNTLLHTTFWSLGPSSHSAPYLVTPYCLLLIHTNHQFQIYASNPSSRMYRLQIVAALAAMLSTGIAQSKYWPVRVLMVLLIHTPGVVNVQTTLVVYDEYPVVSTSTAFLITHITVLGCPPDVTNCPVRNHGSVAVITATTGVTTTVCPLTMTQARLSSFLTDVPNNGGPLATTTTTWPTAYTLPASPLPTHYNIDPAVFASIFPTGASGIVNGNGNSGGGGSVASGSGVYDPAASSSSGVYDPAASSSSGVYDPAAASSSSGVYGPAASSSSGNYDPAAASGSGMSSLGSITSLSPAGSSALSVLQNLPASTTVNGVGTGVTVVPNPTQSVIVTSNSFAAILSSNITTYITNYGELTVNITRTPQPTGGSPGANSTAVGGNSSTLANSTTTTRANSTVSGGAPVPYQTVNISPATPVNFFGLLVAIFAVSFAL